MFCLTVWFNKPFTDLEKNKKIEIDTWASKFLYMLLNLQNEIKYVCIPFCLSRNKLSASNA